MDNNDKLMYDMIRKFLHEEFADQPELYEEVLGTIDRLEMTDQPVTQFISILEKVVGPNSGIENIIPHSDTSQRDPCKKRPMPSEELTYDFLRERLTKGLPEPLRTTCTGLIDIMEAKGLSPNDALDEYARTINEIFEGPKKSSKDNAVVLSDEIACSSFGELQEAALKNKTELSKTILSSLIKDCEDKGMSLEQTKIEIQRMSNLLAK